MSSREKSKAEARRARIEEVRRAERARKRRVRIISVAASAAVAAGVVGGGVAVWSAVEDDQQASSALIRGEETWSDLSQNHVETDVDYPMSPAAGGEHSRVWATCDATVYDDEIREENAVHSLEHGAVWITYNDQATTADIQTLSDRVSARPYSFMSPYRDQSAPITLTAWGHQLGVDRASDPRVEKFLETYVQGEQTPEPGAPCTGGTQ